MWFFWNWFGNYGAWLYALVGITGVFWLSFLWWRKMRMDYDEQGIFALTWVVLSIGIVFGVFGYRLRFGAWGWWEGLGVIGALLALVLSARRRKWDVYEWIDIFMTGLLGWGIVMSLLWGKSRLFETAMLAVGYILAFIMSRTYRRWKWYKSGKPGLVGLVILVWWGITQTAVAFVTPNGLYLGGLTVDQWLGVWLLTFALVVLYLRSGQKLFSGIKPKWQISKLKKTSLSNTR